MKPAPSGLPPAFRALRPVEQHDDWQRAAWRFTALDATQTRRQVVLPFYKPALEMIDERSLTAPHAR